MRHLSYLLFLLPTMFGACSDQPPPQPLPPVPVVITDADCPFPPPLFETQKDNTYKFAAEASGITAAAMGGKAEADVERKFNEQFTGASVVNKIYAASWAGCVACRVAKADKQACLDMFTKLTQNIGSQAGPPISADEKIRTTMALQYSAVVLK